MRGDTSRWRAGVLAATGFALGVALTLAWSAMGSISQAQGTSGNCQNFAATGHKVCGRFLQYWQQNGGLAQQGYPLSEAFTETNALNGKPYTVQYFERVVFELHPENQPPYDVLLSQLGTFLGKDKYTQGFPTVAGQVPFYEDRTDPVNALESFYNAINRKEYERAYSYYEGAPNPLPSLAPPYDQWVKGYASTASVTLAVGKVTMGAAAGNLFANFPVVITAKQTDGSTQVFTGCYTMHRANEGVSPNPNDELWSIRDAKITVAPAGASVDQMLAQNCAP